MSAYTEAIAPTVSSPLAQSTTKSSKSETFLNAIRWLGAALVVVEVFRILNGVRKEYIDIDMPEPEGTPDVNVP